MASAFGKRPLWSTSSKTSVEHEDFLGGLNVLRARSDRDLVPEVDKEIADSVEEAYRRFPDALDAATKLWRNRYSGGSLSLRRVLALRVSPPEWLRLPPDLPRPFGLRDVDAWDTMIPLRSPLPWCRELAAGSCLETDGIPAHSYTAVLLRGLTSAAFNGRVGLLQKWVADSGRWQVKLASGKSLNLFLQSGDFRARLSGDESPRLFRREHLLLFDLMNYRDS